MMSFVNFFLIETLIIIIPRRFVNYVRKVFRYIVKINNYLMCDNQEQIRVTID